MSEKIEYTDEPLGEVTIVSDLLPSPAELSFRESSVEVTALPSNSLRQAEPDGQE